LLLGKNAPYFITKSVFTIQRLDEVLDDQENQKYPQQYHSLWSHVQYMRNGFNQNSVDWLQDLLPNVVHLEISVANESLSVIQLITQLLSGSWRNQLVSLKLWCQFDSSPHEVNRLKVSLISLVDSINQLTALDHLTIDIGHSFFDSDLGGPTVDQDSIAEQQSLPKFDLPILARLKEFYFNSYDFIGGFIVDALRRHTCYFNPPLTKIGTGNFRYADIEKEYSIPDEIAAKFTILTNHKLFHDVSLLSHYHRYQGDKRIIDRILTRISASRTHFSRC